MYRSQSGNITIFHCGYVFTLWKKNCFLTQKPKKTLKVWHFKVSVSNWDLRLCYRVKVHQITLKKVTFSNRVFVSGLFLLLFLAHLTACKTLVPPPGIEFRPSAVKDFPAQTVKRLPTIWFQSLGQEDLLEKEMATHSSILAWKIPWTEEPGSLQSMGSQKVGHDWDLTFTSNS